MHQKTHILSVIQVLKIHIRSLQLLILMLQQHLLKINLTRWIPSLLLHVAAVLPALLSGFWVLFLFLAHSTSHLRFLFPSEITLT